ncbi:MAG: TonB-dependent receptor [Cyanothece sp. SIO2G6]|nr:TonB-dependent receptor [Cyanothece sp. SIO2G6]
MRNRVDGGRYIGTTYSDTNALETASYTLFDLMLGFRAGAFDIQLNANNVTDKDYTVAISDAGLGGGATYAGPGRYVGLSTTVNF